MSTKFCAAQRVIITPCAWHDLQVDWREPLVTRPRESARIPSQFVTKEQNMTEAAQKAVKEAQKPETFAAKAFAAQSAAAPLAPFTLPRRSPRPQDVQIEILFCGVCHSDLHQVRNEWKDVLPTVYPCVPGHEIVGRVVKVGSAVKKFKEGGDLNHDQLLPSFRHPCETTRGIGGSSRRGVTSGGTSAGVV